jgi:hypothetical protein
LKKTYSCNRAHAVVLILMAPVLYNVSGSRSNLIIEQKKVIDTQCAVGDHIGDQIAKNRPIGTVLLKSTRRTTAVADRQPAVLCKRSVCIVGLFC